MKNEDKDTMLIFELKFFEPIQLQYIIIISIPPTLQLGEVIRLGECLVHCLGAVLVVCLL